jgi:hypothetical protein
VTAPRTSGECALLGGAPECLCTRDTANLTEEQVVTRALTKMRFEQRADRAGKAAARHGLDAMLDQARERGPSTLVSELLRMGIMIRLLGEDEADTDEVEAPPARSPSSPTSPHRRARIRSAGRATCPAASTGS